MVSDQYPKKKILVLCTGNSCRSQMAQGFLERNPNLEVFSAGVEVHRVSRRAIQVMREEGIDISGHTSNHVDEYMNIDFDLIITVCDHAKERCPVFPKKSKRVHRNFPDPIQLRGSEKEVLNEFRRVRDLIKDFCDSLIRSIH